jgi:hypothetical protein
MVSGDSMKRIAAAVQGYEHGNRRQSPVNFRTATGDDGGGLKLCKTTSDWEVNTLAELEVWHAGDPPEESSSDETVSDVVNKVAKVVAGTFVLIGEADNGSYYLVEVCRDCEFGHRAERLTENNLDVESVTDDLEHGPGPQVLLHHNGCLKWVGLTKLEVLIDAYIQGENLAFDYREVWVLPDVNVPGYPITVAGVECEDEDGSGTGGGSGGGSGGCGPGLAGGSGTC